MIDYNVVYKDSNGDRHTTEVTSTDARTAIQNALELCPDAHLILSCTPKPMFNE